MSTASNTKLNTHTHTKESQSTNNPFDTVFDDEDTEDEWWEDDVVEPKNLDPTPNPLRITQWPTAAAPVGEPTKKTRKSSTRNANKRSSVLRPIRDKSTKRQKKQNEKAGIKVVTNVSRHQAAAPVLLQASQPTSQRGCFVDLAALQALNGETSQKTTGGFWKSRKGKAIVKEDTATSKSGSQTEHTRFGSDVNHLVPSPSKLNDELSPADRPIVIGLSIPTTDMAGQMFSPQTADSDTTRIVRSYEHRTPTAITPETPTIIITPAQGTSGWSILDGQGTKSHVASSVYSQAPFFNENQYTSKDAPPIPPMPSSHLEEERQRLAGLKSYFSPDSDDATMWENDTTATRSRVVSTCTMFEEDESPILTRAGRARSMSGASMSIRHPSMSTIGTRRQSTGWWNYVTTPFMTRSNTFASRVAGSEPVPALPSLAIAAYKAKDAERDEKNWEKEFSPLTPPTATTVTSDRWWEVDSKNVEKTPNLRDTRHKVEASTATLPLIIPEIGLFSTGSSPNLSSAGSSAVQRADTTSTFRTLSPSSVSPNDREIPMVFESPRVQPQSTGATTAPPQTINILIQAATPQVIQPVRATVIETHSPNVVTVAPSPPQPDFPPPPYSPAPSRLKKYRPVFPPGHALGIQYGTSQNSNSGAQYPPSPAPVSPGLQAAMTSQRSFPMSDVPLTPSARRPINLNSGYPVLPDRPEFAPPPTEQSQVSKKAKKAESKRQRHEKEDAVARRAGGLWRGRGCFSNRGCYGRSGAEGRKRRRWYICLIFGFLSLIILVVVLATQLVRKPATVEEPSQWLNLTGFPPIFTGLSTIVAPVNIEANTACVFPATQWSCHLPKELQTSNEPYGSNQPRFLMRIQWDNSTEANKTFENTIGTIHQKRTVGGNPVSAGQFMKHLLLKARQAVTIIPTPNPPTLAEQGFLGNTTDKIISISKAGEATPFYISLLDTQEVVKSENSKLQTRQTKNTTTKFPDIRSIIPAPSLSADGTAAPANLLPFPSQQPLRLFDRGLSTEHYGFYTYYDRSIFLKSVDSLNQTNLVSGEVPDDQNGGAREGEAKFRCTWRETRFLVQIWTRMNTTSRLLNSTRFATQKIDTTGSPLPQNFTLAGNDFSQPGSFPYPVTVTIDRHGGEPKQKMLYCYSMDERRKLIVDSAQLHDEDRGFGGTLINRAPSFFSNTSDPSLGGFDGGSGGCACRWRNFEDVIKL